MVWLLLDRRVLLSMRLDKHSDVGAFVGGYFRGMSDFPAFFVCLRDTFDAFSDMVHGTSVYFIDR